MNPTDYQRLCSRTECDQVKSLDRMDNESPVAIRLNHSIIGLTGEVGELASLLQKWIYYGKPWTGEMLLKFKDEFGDVLWYVAEGLNALGLDMAEVMQANINKLAKRYPSLYTNEAADEANRDRAAEAAAVREVVGCQTVDSDTRKSPS